MSDELICDICHRPTWQLTTNVPDIQLAETTPVRMSPGICAVCKSKLDSGKWILQEDLSGKYSLVQVSA